MAIKTAAQPRKIEQHVPLRHSDKIYHVETKDDESGFWFRIMCNDGRNTHWAQYTQCAYMDGLVAATAYYLGTSDIPLMTAQEFCAQTMVG